MRLPIRTRVKSGIKYWWYRNVGDTSLPSIPALPLLMAVIIAISMLWVATSMAHDWYEPACCSGDDCKPVAATDVLEVEGGWKYLPTGYVFKGDQVRPSRDRNFHVCITKTGTHYCIYILTGA